jgi:hypothetical protein
LGTAREVCLDEFNPLKLSYHGLETDPKNFLIYLNLAEDVLRSKIGLLFLDTCTYLSVVSQQQNNPFNSNCWMEDKRMERTIPSKRNLFFLKLSWPTKYLDHQRSSQFLYSFVI